MNYQIISSLVLGVSATCLAGAATIRFAPNQLSDFQSNGAIAEQQQGGIATSTITDPTVESPNVLRFQTLITIPGQAIYTHEWLGATVTPAIQGAITSIDFSVELSDPSLGDMDTSLHLLLIQGGNQYFYTANGSIARSFRPNETDSNFVLRSANNLAATNFGLFNPALGAPLNVDGSMNPDFSSSGSEFQVAIATFSGTDNVNLDRYTDARDFEILIQTIPEPNSLGLLALASLGCLRRTRN